MYTDLWTYRESVSRVYRGDHRFRCRSNGREHRAYRCSVQRDRRRLHRRRYRSLDPFGNSAGVTPVGSDGSSGEQSDVVVDLVISRSEHVGK